MGNMGAMFRYPCVCRLNVIMGLCLGMSGCGDSSSAKSNIDLVGAPPVEKKVVSAVLAEPPAAADDFGVDLIEDLVFRKQRDGWTLTTPHAHVTVDKLKTAGIHLVFSAISQASGKMSLKTLNKALADMDALLTDAKGEVVSVRDFKEARETAAEGRIAVMLLVEGADIFQNDFSLLLKLKKRGLAMVGLVFTKSNAFADAAVSPPREERGLTQKGREFLRACRDLNILADLTHASKKTFWDALVDQSGAVAVSHSAARALMDHPRNLDDLQIIGLNRYGGLLGLLFNPEFLTPGKTATIDDVTAHIMHIKALGAVSSLALGTDFGGITPPSGLEDAAALPKLKAALARQGVTDAEIKGIFGENALRFFKEASAAFGAETIVADDILIPAAVDCDDVSGTFDGPPASACNSYVRDAGTTIYPSGRLRVRLRDMSCAPIKLEIFGDPNVPWQVEAQNLKGRILFHRTVQLDANGNGAVGLPSDRKLTRLFLSPTRASALKEAVVWARAPTRAEM